MRLPPHFETIQHLGRCVGPENVMFEPLYVMSQSGNYLLEDYVLRKGFKVLVVDDSKSFIPRQNPAIVVYDGGLSMLEFAANREQLMPPKGTGVMYLTGIWKGHVHGLPHPEEFLEWFFERKISYWDPEKGNFRISPKPFSLK